MKIFRLFVFSLFIGAGSSAYAKESFLCVYQSGDLSFDVNTVLIERDGKGISVFRVSSGKEIRDDHWSYQVFSEDKMLGLQAIRSNPSGGAKSTVAVEYGGLLFLMWGEGGCMPTSFQRKQQRKKQNHRFWLVNVDNLTLRSSTTAQKRAAFYFLR